MSGGGTSAVMAPTMASDAFAEDAIAACSRTIREHSKSFALASRLLPRPARDEAVVLYAWCRYADDAVDEAPPGEAAAALARLDAELDAIYAGAPQGDTVLAAFQQLVHRRAIPRIYPEALLRGMRMDVDGARYPDEEALLRYCYRVASVVGLMMCHVMGLRSMGPGSMGPRSMGPGRDDALQQAAHLGVAMQITNICRDVAEDWGRGRRYLPADAIAACGGVPSEPPAGGESSLPADAIAPFTRVIERLLARADAFYASGHRGLDALPWQSALAVEAAARVYRDIGRVIAARGHDPRAGRAWTSKGRKLWLVGRALIGVAARAPRRLWLRLTRGGFAPPRRVLPFEAMDRLDGTAPRSVSRSVSRSGPEQREGERWEGER